MIVKLKKCKICNKEFTPRSSLNKYCSYDCNDVVIKDATKRYQAKKKLPKPTLSKLKNKADHLWRSVGKVGAVCCICSKLPEYRVSYNQLHPHHIVGRKNMLLRWDLRNRIWLCPYHHTLGPISAHNTPFWFNETFFKSIRPSDYEYLKEKEKKIIKVSSDFVLEKIRELETPINI